MNDEQAQQLGAYISQLRKGRAMTVRRLAERAGIDNGGLTRLEHGGVREPKPTTLCAIAKALHVSAVDMFALAGYTVPQDLPCIEQYLKTKYSHIPVDDAWEISRAVERAANIYCPDPVPKDTSRNESEPPTT